MLWLRLRIPILPAKGLLGPITKIMRKTREKQVPLCMTWCPRGREIAAFFFPRIFFLAFLTKLKFAKKYFHMQERLLEEYTGGKKTKKQNEGGGPEKKNLPSTGNQIKTSRIKNPIK